MFIETKHGYLNAQHIVRLCVDTVLRVGSPTTWELYAETTNGKRYPLIECLSKEKADKEMDYSISCLNWGVGLNKWQK